MDCHKIRQKRCLENPGMLHDMIWSEIIMLRDFVFELEGKNLLPRDDRLIFVF